MGFDTRAILISDGLQLGSRTLMIDQEPSSSGRSCETIRIVLKAMYGAATHDIQWDGYSNRSLQFWAVVAFAFPLFHRMQDPQLGQTSGR